MDYTITIYKRQGESLCALWIDILGGKSSPGTVWEAIQKVEIITERPIPAALCGLLLMSESTSDHLFRQIADTWLGLAEDDPLNDYDRHVSREESKAVLNRDYLDRLEEVQRPARSIT